MNHTNSTIGTRTSSTHQVSGKAPSSGSPELSREVHRDRGGKLQKIARYGEMNPRLVCLLQPTSRLAESYFRLRHTLEEMRSPESGFVVAVTSPGEGDGKTLTAINLAGALAQDTRARVLLVDLNLRHSGANVRTYLDLQQGADSGASDWLGGETSGDGLASYQLEGFNLHLIPSGAGVDSPYERLKSPRLEELFGQARKSYDYIIVDTPQALLLPDIGLIARVVDGFLVVVRADSTPQEKLGETLDLMTQDKVLGLVLNGSRGHR